jgi:hypothetical protein
VDSSNRVHIVYQDRPVDQESFYRLIDPYLDDRSGDAADPATITLAGPTQLTPGSDGFCGNHPRVTIGPGGEVLVTGKQGSYGENTGGGDVWLVELDGSGNIVRPYTWILGGQIHHKANPVGYLRSDGTVMMIFGESAGGGSYCRRNYAVFLDEDRRVETGPVYIGGRTCGPTAYTHADGNEGAALVYTTSVEKWGDEKEIYVDRLNREGKPAGKSRVFSGKYTHPRFAMDEDGNLHIMTKQTNPAAVLRYTLADFEGHPVFEQAALPDSFGCSDGQYCADNYSVALDDAGDAHFFYTSWGQDPANIRDRKSTRLNSSHNSESRMPSSA